MENRGLRIALFAILFLLSASLGPAGCDRTSERRITLYTSVDQPIAAPIVEIFERQTGIKVTLVTDTEASKSVGLAERLRAEKSDPQCDVWWGNEPFHTINLAEEGLFQPYESPAANEIEPRYRDVQHRWTGNGLRARVIARSIRDSSGSISSIAQLSNPTFKGKLAIARPTAGTTGGHVAALFVAWGDERATAFFRGLHANQIKLLGGNGAVAEAVGNGTAVLGLTDNDDVAAMQREGGQLEPILPDQDSAGTLMIPTTVALVANATHPGDARKLVDYLLSKQVEQQMIEAKFAGWSSRTGATGPKPMQVNYDEVARALPAAVRRATAILEGRDE